MPRYALDLKIRALDWLRDGNDYEEVSQKTDVPISTLRSWQRRRESLRQEYRQRLRDEAAHKMAEVQHRLANKAAQLIAAMDSERIDKAPLNQISSALGMLIDRYLKLQDAQKEDDDEHSEQVIRYEFRHPDGSLQSTPYFAEGRGKLSGAVQGGGVREALGEDGTGKDYTNGQSRVSWDEDVVAGADLPDGESGLARFEDDDDERNWYHD